MSRGIRGGEMSRPWPAIVLTALAAGYTIVVLILASTAPSNSTDVCLRCAIAAHRSSWETNL
jgi:hypothetical protein